MANSHSNGPIVALSTPPGVSALAVARLTGEGCIEIVNRAFHGADLEQAESRKALFGLLKDGDQTIDEVVVTVFRAPASFTREDMAEVSCHGSPYIAGEIVKLMVRLGARLAAAGEFTRRAFLNGRFDLAQAEAVADLIHSRTAHEHRAAVHQMRGGFSAALSALRAQALDLTSLLELELDFSEEDVEFADRTRLNEIVKSLLEQTNPLIESFSVGNAIKNGVATVIAGRPNAGKSTLLNALLNEERAIVSDIAGTTRDVIEDQMVIDGVAFRFIDTAGLRDTQDAIEAVGVERAREQMDKAAVIIYLFDLSASSIEEITSEIDGLKKHEVPLLLTGNKKDQAPPALLRGLEDMEEDFVLISASAKDNLDGLKKELLRVCHLNDIDPSGTIVTNVRHYEQLVRARESLEAVQQGLVAGLTADLLAEDLRQALHHLGEITGEVTNEEVLGNIFGRFCIGK